MQFKCSTHLAHSKCSQKSAVAFDAADDNDDEDVIFLSLFFNSNDSQISMHIRIMWKLLLLSKPRPIKADSRQVEPGTGHFLKPPAHFNAQPGSYGIFLLGFHTPGNVRGERVPGMSRNMPAGT